ncbi:bifunctional 5,10-methylenetetrahydrofolate dehydrogenase/5,10-methenyltetrahydrofolate cyclohydrolase [Clostridium estertheticum]|uniref:Bifunctional protein FolD n=1 Tax=Clostridium estertheticum subsp. estertheticum TaxID=1552 RepID=A0A1J0GHZ2_9CLOT|nr:tetrahydrofolate dehydrogenase/cyclohydrolase catalytic domain-containing protein [Clostridium estertheticum]APC41012.1 bifunctional methylenetetrahydrofolate dehydrogenase/methenyltetrahydrofolate cyclohydrolase [Clostridium estertheticum subsp. estertheticum]MBU3074077.1 bifunctional methylenetetrahydrofolate dehydrogenase/methenyltetrahydrofolate cyclohydrolase [Clostridium estertheticum]MBU3164171.1 bifunctional methylenetetrahydrofolate dehydrogenase/methenyltetrahydrofolate cyclohydrola
MGIRVNGKLIVETYRDEIKNIIKDGVDRGLRAPSIKTILVGSDGGSLSYVRSQNNLCNKLGISYACTQLEQDISQKDIIDIIEKFNEDNSVDGIIIQLPLPKNLNEKEITSKISYKKDIDGLTDVNMGRFYKGDKSFIPCTALGVIEMIKNTGCNIKGKHAVVIGRSNIVGKPVAQLLLNEDATVTICHSKTTNLKEVCKTADIIVAAIGKPGFVTSEFIKKGAIVIDVGTTMIDDKITGDVNFDDVINHASFVTPVPGGTGLMTTTMLIKNACASWRDNVY